MSAPTLISYVETADSIWQNSGTPRSVSASVSWLTNDVLVFLGFSEVAGVTLTPADATGVAWGAALKSTTAAGCCSGYLYATVATGNGSATFSCTNTNSGGHWGFSIWVIRGSAGIGTSTEQHTTTKTKALVPSGADGLIIWGSGDFSAEAAPAGTPTSPAITTRQSFQDGTSFSVGIFNMADQTSAGSVSYGITTAGTTGPYSLLAVEIKAGAASATAALTGTATASITEADIVAGGKTIIVTLVGDTWIPS